jgi:hypothetical protein
VVAHAARQRQRGKNPSIRYRNFSNPKCALEAAQADIDARITADDDYTAAFSGRIALIKAFSERQREVAHQYAENRMDFNGAVGAAIGSVEDGEVIQAPLHYRVAADEGTVHIVLPI